MSHREQWLEQAVGDKGCTIEMSDNRNTLELLTGFFIKLIKFINIFFNTIVTNFTSEVNRNS